MNTCLNQINELHDYKIPGWLNHAEKNFIKVLNQVVGNNAFVFTKIRVSDVLRNLELPESYNANDFNNEVFDFVICDKQDLSIISIIELDDRPIKLQKEFLEQSYDAICLIMNIPLIKIPARCGYDTMQLRKLIFYRH